MSLFEKHKTIPSYLKYLFSYLIIVTVLILGFYLIIRKQLIEEYYVQCEEKAKTQLDSVAEQLKENITFLAQVDSAILKNEVLRDFRYAEKMTSGKKYEARNELGKYRVSSNMIHNIVLLSEISGEWIHLYYSVNWEEGIFKIEKAGMPEVIFDPTQYLDEHRGQLLLLADEYQQYLIYFPATSSQSNYVFFYMLSLQGIMAPLKNLHSEEIPALALVDKEGRMVTEGEFPKGFSESIQTYKSSGLYELNSSDTLYVHNEISGGMSLVALLSKDFLNRQVYDIFIRTYVTLILLGLVGFLMIIWSMRLTFLPLHRLAEKVAPDSKENPNYLERLERAFQEADYEIQMINNKLEGYRSTMQKSLLDSFVGAGKSSAESEKLDALFERGADKIIALIALRMPDDGKGEDYYLKYIENKLLQKNSCIVLEGKENAIVFLLNYIPDESVNEAFLRNVADQLYRQEGCLVAISNVSESPLNIPLLYEEVSAAMDYWPAASVVDSSKLYLGEVAQEYPHDKLTGLEESLKAHDFLQARLLMQEIWQIVDRYESKRGNIRKFFIPCILIDVLTNIVNSMNWSQVPFDKYNELYYETLYFCRSCPYSEKQEEIVANITKLVELCEQVNTERMAKTLSYIQVVEERYCQEDFSIADLADEFDVSISYMSKLFKQGQNMNFTDYLWMLRLRKAKELLLKTNMTVDEISVAVGYSNTSSFRRKFKAETGISPSQFRLEYQCKG